MKKSKVAVEHRRERLMAYLQTNQKVEVVSLAEMLEVTPSTIRRDLEYYEKKGCVQRFFGGAKYIGQAETEPHDQTDQKGRDDRERRERAIARTAAAMAEDGDILFLNGSPMSVFILEYLSCRDAVVVTNNARALYARREPGISLHLTGGEVYGKTQSLVGQFAVRSLSMVTATKCVLGVSGISADGGITSSVIQEIAVNEQMLTRCSGPRIVVADSSKVGVTHNFYNGKISDITHLITDSGADKSELDRIREQGVEVIIASDQAD